MYPPPFKGQHIMSPDVKNSVMATQNLLMTNKRFHKLNRTRKNSRMSLDRQKHSNILSKRRPSSRQYRPRHKKVNHTDGVTMGSYIRDIKRA